MRLPGIDYGGRTQRLDTVAPSAYVSEGNAWAGAASAWANVVDRVGENIENLKADEAAAAAKREQQDLEIALSNGVWDVERLGQPPAEVQIPTRDRLGDQKSYQTHEFAGQMYDYSTEKIAEKYTKGLSSGAAKKARAKIYGYATQRRAQVYEDQANRARDYEKGVLLNTINTAVSGATWQTRDQTIVDVNQMLGEAVKQNTIDLPTAEGLRVKALDNVTYMAVLDEVNNAQSEEQLKVLEQQLFASRINGQPARMSPDNFRKVLTAIDQQEQVLDVERDERHENNLRYAIVAQESGALDPAEVTNLLGQDAISVQGFKTLRALERASKEGIRYINPAQRSQWRGEIASLRYLKPGETVSSRAAKLGEDLLAARDGYYRDDTPYMGTRITGEDYGLLDEELRTEIKRIENDPTFQSVMQNIRMWTGTDGMIDLSKNTNNTRAYLAFKEAARSYYDRKGVDANMQDWFNENKAQYDPTLFNSGREPQRLRVMGLPERFFDKDDRNKDVVRTRDAAAWAKTEFESGQLSKEQYHAISTTLTMSPVAPDNDDEKTLSTRIMESFEVRQ